MDVIKKMGDIFALNLPEVEPEELEATEPKAQAKSEEITPVFDIKSAPADSLSAKGEEGEGIKKIITVHPQSYGDAENIGRFFRQGTPVIMNLDQMNDADARRLIDFIAGVVYALEGTLEKITNRAFLLSPQRLRVERAPRESSANSNIFNKI